MSSVKTARRKSTSTASKLRNSCDACALSKVKCPKEKPSCSRCAKRSIACEYSVPKRPGRKRDSDWNDSDTGMRYSRTPTVQSGLATAWYSPDTSATLPDLNASLVASTRLSSMTHISSRPAVVLDPVTALETGVYPERPEINKFSSGPLTFPVEFPESGSFDCSFSSFNQATHNATELCTSDEGDLEPSFCTNSQYRNSNSDSSSLAAERQEPTAYAIHASSGIPETESRCRCMEDVLCLMKRLFSPIIPKFDTLSSNSYLMSPCVGTTDTDDISPLQRTQIVLVENKQFIKVVTNILKCSCAERGYLLTMLSTITLRILERYRAAAQMHPVPGQFPPYRTTSSHKTSQMVLSELHHVQVLLARLALRIDTCREHAPGIRTGPGHCSAPRTAFEGSTNPDEFSVTALGQMQTDLQNCLSRLSLDIINILKHI